MFIMLLIKRFQRIREQKKQLSALGAVWLLILIELAWIEFRIICFWAPLCLDIYERRTNRRRRRLRRRKTNHGDDRETEVKR